MIINKILNNNVVITLDDNDEEIIVMGKGIGYQKSKGNLIDKTKVNKVFRISNKEVSNKLQELLNNIPIEHMKLSSEIIEYAQIKLNKKLNESIYISLSDHTYSAIQRMKEGINVKNAILWEIKRFYKEEFEIGMKALDIIENKTGVKLPEDEAGFIAFHIVNAQLSEGHTFASDITKLIQEVLSIVRYHFRIEFHEESVFYYRFIMHLKFFAQRLLLNNAHEGGTDKELLSIIKSKYNKEFECVVKIKDFIKKQYNYILTDDELIYLTIHLAKVVKDSNI
ncbi:BglG family transcription antiterminator LicT [Clostridioides difficile]|uniref:PTS operon transcription antiterminator n=4 Tax=Clostridioides difficile TaxID=1496 RepID=A0AAX3GXZ0_CLODI|nr:PRD domain-containing protein [Clostridioides difficile]AXU69552.1 transcription antiterminator [Clostridioides difficile]AXU91684.1 transcription antiterminator [Clostridioides difficile]EFH05926.1 transcription antiterminator LicT [Clostridioides difficile NAP08]EFH17274.1 transcription antiterminator LicT [Clostridioides difficile NAP07]EII6766753.1 PRD domain-containing protein [Clostridioides difficile]